MCVGDNDSCEPSWTEHENSNVLNGVENTASSVDACKLACVDNPSCDGIDWTNGQQCFLHGSWSGRRNIGTSTGVTHYNLTRCGQSTEANQHLNFQLMRHFF